MVRACVSVLDANGSRQQVCSVVLLMLGMLLSCVCAGVCLLRDAVWMAAVVCGVSVVSGRQCVGVRGECGVCGVWCWYAAGCLVRG